MGEEGIELGKLRHEQRTLDNDGGRNHCSRRDYGNSKSHNLLLLNSLWKAKDLL